MLKNSKRLYLFTAHLGISFIILLVLLYLIFFKWYPHDLFLTSGGWHGTKIVFFVDMVLGPMLTLILSNPVKDNAELIRDLCFCALIQISALSYGVNILLSTKPVILSIHDGAIHAIQYDQIENLPNPNVFDNYSGTPPLVYSADINKFDVSDPEFKQRARKILSYGAKYGVPVHAVPETFDDIANRRTELSKITALSLSNISESQQYNEAQLKAITNKSWFVLPLDGSFKDSYIAFDEKGNIKESICCH